MMATSNATIFLTGANGGLGTAIVDDIISKAEFSGCHGIYTVRDAKTSTSLHSALQASQSHSHEILSLDLSNLSNVRQVAATVNAKVANGEIPRIKALILNAAYREHQGQTRTESGLDIAFASNYLGHWLLVLLLLESMDQESGRIVVVSSWVHDPLDEGNKASGAYEDPKWKKIFVDTKSETLESVAQGTWSPPGDPSKDPYGLAAIRRYGASKLCLVMMIIELQRRLNSDPKLSGISILGVDPGLMPTKITTGSLGWLIRSIYTLVMHISGRIWPNGSLRLKSKSAGDVLAAAISTKPPFGERPKGLYMNGSEPKEVSVEAQDEQKRANVWKASITYTGLKDGQTCLVDWA
ncbi:hypothetical protein KVR01_007143 [Diaporthe batatas]|uniref:uncharacterized protein n=1 Tax=Diaporthe batatas TaxID=748121 RepID=UPI001D03BBEE|nr:uncharacterized protein KVR01_007143 [Diaporthe batatas]KAG8162665.1 hypothetical protein KVR01_007143 [Diaporthe batatas]